MPQGLPSTPATFNYLVNGLVRRLRTFVQTYIDDILVHIRAGDGQTVMEVHLKHLRRVSDAMRANKIYTNIDKCAIAAEKIKVLGCFVSRVGVRADPGKVKAITAWPTPRSQKDLRNTAQDKMNTLDPCNISERRMPTRSLQGELGVCTDLALPDENKPFSVIGNVSDYTIGYALLQKNIEGCGRVISS
ncbi:Pol protein [Phytophthora palmivora]|uniref:Pol protein n=1 Tax=Phytophthora palmivora TaxID=4796 RepID=A0A2P4XIM6_9STRA|nr:Pol protein [Phytophthora palmivora]